MPSTIIRLTLHALLIISTLPKGYGDTLKIMVHLTTPLPSSTIGATPFNPFMIINMDREKEVHLVGHVPTSLADKSLFGTGNDNSNTGTGNY
jgi:LruC domain-containing protein